MLAAPRAVGRSLPFTDDPFQAHVAGVIENQCPLSLQVLVELYAVMRANQQSRQRGLAPFKRLAPQVVTI
jgi:hypothetical protein